MFALSVFLRLFRWLLVFSQRQYWRFLYKAPLSKFYTTPATAFEKSADDGELCVSTPGPRVSYRHFNPHFLPTVSPAGGDRVTAWLSPTKLLAVDQDAGTDHPCVPAPSTVDHAVQSPFLFPWWFMILPTNLLCPSSCRSPLVRCCRESADVHKPLVQTSTTDRTPHLTVEPFLSLGN